MKQLLELRRYQVESVEGLRALIRQGVRSMILSLPTGGSKVLQARG
ncbi:hypothetical protein [Pseudoduganella lutea]|nr:hypothetical protein [Pseudoduganella lutea]